MKSAVDREVYKELAARHKLPIAVIEKIIEAVYTDLKNTIEDETQDGYNIPFFGKFYQTEGKLLSKLIIKQIYACHKRKLQNLNSQSESTESGI